MKFYVFFFVWGGALPISYPTLNRRMIATIWTILKFFLSHYYYLKLYKSFCFILFLFYCLRKYYGDIQCSDLRIFNCSAILN